MLKLFVILISLVVAGCATGPNPVFAPPPPNCINVPGEGCKKISAGNVGGTTLGHHENESTVEKNNY